MSWQLSTYSLRGKIYSTLDSMAFYHHVGLHPMCSTLAPVQVGLQCTSSHTLMTMQQQVNIRGICQHLASLAFYITKCNHRHRQSYAHCYPSPSQQWLAFRITICCMWNKVGQWSHQSCSWLKVVLNICELHTCPCGFRINPAFQSDCYQRHLYWWEWHYTKKLADTEGDCHGWWIVIKELPPLRWTTSYEGCNGEPDNLCRFLEILRE